MMEQQTRLINSVEQFLHNYNMTIKILQIIIGADCDGFALKEAIKSVNLQEILNCAVEIVDVGSYAKNDGDYPVYTKKVVKLLKKFIPFRRVAKQKTFGVCVSSNGIETAIVANRHKKIRAVVCSNEKEAVFARTHLNANILCLGANLINETSALETLIAFLETPFSGKRNDIRKIKQF